MMMNLSLIKRSKHVSIDDDHPDAPLTKNSIVDGVVIWSCLTGTATDGDTVRVDLISHLIGPTRSSLGGQLTRFPIRLSDS